MSLDLSRVGVRLTWAAWIWVAGTLAVAAGFLSLHAAQGTFMNIAGISISPVNLGEIGAACLFAASLYVFRKRMGIGFAGYLESWLWAHICLGSLGIMFIWFHSRQRFSQSELLANGAMLLMIATVVGGFAGRVLYVLLPHFLQRLPDYDPPAILQQRIEAIEREIASFLPFKSANFRELHGALLRRLAASASPTGIERGWIDQARASLAADEVEDFDRLASLLSQRAALDEARVRRLRYRVIADGWWRLHAWLSEAAWILAALHILTSVFIDRRLS